MTIMQEATPIIAMVAYTIDDDEMLTTTQRDDVRNIMDSSLIKYCPKTGVGFNAPGYRSAMSENHVEEELSRTQGGYGAGTIACTHHRLRLRLGD